MDFTPFFLPNVAKRKSMETNKKPKMRLPKALKLELLLLLLVCGCIKTFAKDVTLNEAKEIATSFVKDFSRKSSKAKAAIRNVNKVKHCYTSSHNGCNAFYVFNIGNDGFVIISAEDQTEEVLGYSVSGSFDINGMPSNAKAWMEYLQHSVLDLKRQGTKAYSASSAYSAIEPLIKSQWDQGDPYNKLCPNNSYTGCVATAMAQVINYYRWPEMTAQPIPAYTTLTNGFQIPELPVTSFAWDYMTTDDISKLMYYCGVSVQADFTGNSTGASNHLALRALKTYFDYDASIQFHSRTSFTADEWESMLYQELKEGRPVLYFGNSTGGGHAFVCDGYEDGLYHINWGWSGYCDGFFRLSILNPHGSGAGGSSTSDGYSMSQSVITGIKPNTGMPQEVRKTLDVTCLRLVGETVLKRDNADGTFGGLSVQMVVSNSQDNTFNGSVGLALYQNGDLKDVICQTEVNGMEFGWATESNFEGLNMEKSYLAGEYQMKLVCKPSGSASWTPCDGSELCYIQASVTDKEMTLKALPSALDIKGNSLTFTEGKEIKKQALRLNVTNNGSEFNGVIAFYLNGKSISATGAYLSSGATEDYDFECMPDYGVNEIRAYAGDSWYGSPMTLIYSEDVNIIPEGEEDNPFYNPADNQMIGGFYHSNDYETGAGITMFHGINKTGQIYTPEILAVYKGNKITHVRFAMNEIGTAKNFQLWMGTELDKQDVLVQDISEVKNGWNVVKLDNPVTIDGSQICMGISCEFNMYEEYDWEKIPSFGIVFIDIPGAGMMYNEQAYGKTWNSQSGWRPGGIWAMQFITEGEKNYDYDVQLRSTSMNGLIDHNPYYRQGESVDVQIGGLRVENAGKKKVKTATICWQIDDRPATILIDGTLESDGSSITIPGDLEVGPHKLRFFVSKIDGNEFFDAPSHEIVVPIKVWSKDMGRQKLLLFNHKWLDNEAGKSLDQDIVKAKTERGDIAEFTMLETDNGPDPDTDAYFNLHFWPGVSAVIDRYASPEASFMTEKFKTVNNDILDAYKKVPAFATINISASVNDNNLLEITVSGERNEEFVPLIGNTNINVFLTEDDLEATLLGWGIDGLVSPYPTDYKHQGVLRQIITPTWGTPIEWNGDNYRMTFTTKLSAGINPANLKVIAFLGNAFNYHNYGDIYVVNAEEIPLKNIDLSAVEKLEDRLAFVINGDGNASVRARMNKLITGDILVLPSTAIIDGKEYRVDRVDANGFISPKVKHIVISEGIERIGTWAITQSSILQSVTIPASVKWYESDAIAVCSNLSSITVAPENTVLKMDGGHLLSKDGECFYLYTVGDGATSVKVPDGVKYIYQGYEYSRSIEKVTIPEGVLGINKGLTFCTNLKEVQLPSTLESIGEGFCGCSSLEEVTIPANVRNASSCDIFSSCDNLKRIYMKGSVPPEITIYTDEGFGATVYNNATLYVPTGSKEAYMSAPCWNKFQKIEEYNATSVRNPSITNDNSKAPVYNLSGQRLRRVNANGIYIKGNRKVFISVDK